MNTSTLPHRLHLQHSLTDRLFTAAQRWLAHWIEHRAQRREADMALAVERELQQLDPRTLCDIGAPQGLVGQRRWQAEQDEWSRERTLRSHGW
jgi:hypothetical protein